MQSALLGLVAQHPELLATHVQSYFALAKEALGQQARLYQRKLVWLVLAGACFVVAAVHAGMLVMLYFVLEPALQSSLWLASAVPLASVLLGAACLGLCMRRASSDPFDAWNEQVATDLALLRPAVALV
jgi:hypothetical protein